MFINILVAAVIGACAGLLWYGLTKIPAIQKQFQKIPKWASLIVVLAVVKIFHPMIADEFNCLLTAPVYSGRRGLMTCARRLAQFQRTFLSSRPPCGGRSEVVVLP